MGAHVAPFNRGQYRFTRGVCGCGTRLGIADKLCHLGGAMRKIINADRIL